MYAIVNDVLYRYSDFLDDVRIFTKNNEKAHNGMLQKITDAIGNID